MSGTQRNVAIIGAGKVGSAIGVLLARSGYDIRAVSSGTHAGAQAAAERIGTRALDDPAEAARHARLIFVTTPDDVIGCVCEQLVAGGGIASGDFVFHMSGAVTNDVLEPAREAGAQVGSIHPMQSFADVDDAMVQLAGSVFGVTAEGDAVRVAREIVDALGGEAVAVAEGQKVLYHAAACVISNYLVVLADQAEELYRIIGVDPEEARRAYVPLAEGTLANIARCGPTHALTGPIMRGDVETVASHMRAMRDVGLNASLYCSLGRHAVAIAQRRGALSDARAAQLTATLDQAMEEVAS